MPEERLLQVFHWWMQMQKEGFLQKQEKAGSPPPPPFCSMMKIRGQEIQMPMHMSCRDHTYQTHHRNQHTFCLSLFFSLQFLFHKAAFFKLKWAVHVL